MLEQENVNVDTSLSGTIAIQLIKERLQNGQPLYNCIFLDYSMPEKDGPQTAFDIRSLCEENGVQKPYICCVTAYSEAHFKTNALESGMDEFIVKPINHDQLLSILKSTNCSK